MPTEIEILIADDHPVVRQGLRQAIEQAPGLKVVAEAGDGQEALTHLRRLQPQIAVLDIDMPRLDGFSLAQTLRTEAPETKVLFLTVHRQESFLKKALAVGARGYISKDSPLSDIVTAINVVVGGEVYISPILTGDPQSRRKPSACLGLSSLTATERKVLKLIADYNTTKDISALLAVSPRTVETHRANICQKLGLHGSHALMKYAVVNYSDL